MTLSKSGLTLTLFSIFFLLAETDGRAQGNFVYINEGPLVEGFSFTAGGAFAPVPGSPFPTGGGPQFGSFILDNIAVSPAGNFLYVPNGKASTIAAFSINPTTGALSPVPGSPFQTGIGVSNITIAVTPDGRFLYAAGNGNLHGFSIASDGSLAMLPSPPAFLEGPTFGYPNITPDGKFLLMPIPFDSIVFTFKVGPDGALTPALGSPLNLGMNGPDVRSVAFNAAGDLAFIAPGAVTVSIAPTGTLTVAPVPPSPVDGFTIVATPDGRFAYFNDQSGGVGPNINAIEGVAVAPDGTLRPVPGNPFIVGPSNSDRAPVSMAISGDGSLLLSANGDATLSIFAIGTMGTLTPAPGSPFQTAGGFGNAIATFPAARHVSKSGPLFDMCVSDLFTGDQIQFNSRTGDYRYANCHTGISLVGRGAVSGSGCPVTLNDASPNHKVSIAACGVSGSALARSAALGINASFSNTGSAKCGCN
jgi:6-phosphogluconolactonase